MSGQHLKENKLQNV